MKREHFIWVAVVALLVFMFLSRRTSYMEMSDLDYNDSIMFYNPDGTEYSSKDVERTEQETCDKYITSEDIVLELGSRYGTLSCLLARKANKVVALDPDVEAIETCKKNMERHNVNFEALHGIVSKESQQLVDSGGYGNYTQKGESNIPNFSINEIEDKYGVKFNTLIADCEGCLERVLNENNISNIRKILFETDRPDSCNYEKVYSFLTENEFKNVYQSGYPGNDLIKYHVWIKH